MFLGNFGEYSDVIPASGEILGPPLFGGLRSVAAVFSHFEQDTSRTATMKLEYFSASADASRDRATMFLQT